MIQTYMTRPLTEEEIFKLYIKNEIDETSLSILLDKNVFVRKNSLTYKIEEAMKMRGYKPFQSIEAQELIEKGFKVVPKDETSRKMKASVQEW